MIDKIAGELLKQNSDEKLKGRYLLYFRVIQLFLTSTILLVGVKAYLKIYDSGSDISAIKYELFKKSMIDSLQQNSIREIRDDVDNLDKSFQTFKESQTQLHKTIIKP